MPTPPLLVLHSILRSLSLNIPLPHLASTSPSLLLLLLESLLGRRLPLDPHLRHPDNGDDEVELAKCVVGVLAAELCMDLSVVEPERVVAGAEGEVGVVVMALAVLARRRGVELDLDPESEGEDEDERGAEGQGADETTHGRAYSRDGHARDETHMASRSYQSRAPYRSRTRFGSLSRSLADTSTSSHSAHSLIDDPVDYVSVRPIQPQLLDMYTTPPRRDIGDVHDQGGYPMTYADDEHNLDDGHSHAHGSHESKEYATEHARSHPRDYEQDHSRNYDHHAQERTFETTTSLVSSLRSPSPIKGGYRSALFPIASRASTRAGTEGYADEGYTQGTNDKRSASAAGRAGDAVRIVEATYDRYEHDRHADNYASHHPALTQRSVSSGTGSSGRNRTMLQTLIDEFGLLPR